MSEMVTRAPSTPAWWMLGDLAPACLPPGAACLPAEAYHTTIQLIAIIIHSCYY